MIRAYCLGYRRWCGRKKEEGDDDDEMIEGK